MITTEDKISSTGIINRDKLIRTQTPQAFSLGKLLWAHKEAAKCNIDSSIATCSLMIELGETVHFSLGSEKNIKLTTPEDIDILKALFFQKMQKG
jgi:2-C-methyl-D-erythritol 4-phosphate cytidylyltransferase